MNIFYIDENPALCAKYHCDKHVVKMILESAQLLCTAINVVVGEQVTPYKSTHVNHPCSIWVRECYANWFYVYRLMLALEDEWRYRYDYSYNKLHKSVKLLVDDLIADEAYSRLPESTFTSPPLCMPEEYKVSNNAVESYRKYYREGKKDLLFYKRREIPAWLF